jgi:hypothetical protein
MPEVWDMLLKDLVVFHRWVRININISSSSSISLSNNRISINSKAQPIIPLLLSNILHHLSSQTTKPLKCKLLLRPMRLASHITHTLVIIEEHPT